MKKYNNNFEMAPKYLGPLMKLPMATLQILTTQSVYHISIEALLLRIFEFSERFLKIVKKSGTGSSSTWRNTTTPKNARARDGDACIVTRSAFPEMAHLFPFAALSRSDAVDTTYKLFKAMKWLVGAAIYNRWEPKMILKGLEKDKGNLIALTPVIHHLLDNGLCAFECTGTDKKTAADGTTTWKNILKFHFLPLCSTRTASSIAGIRSEIANVTHQIDNAQQGGLSPRVPKPPCKGYIGAFLQTGEKLKSGHLFNVTHKDEQDAEMCCDMTNIHWECMGILTIAGKTEI